MRPICFHCQKAMEIEKNDVAVKDKRTGGFEATLWLGDRFLCHGCGGSVVVGFGEGRIESDCSPERVKAALEFSQ